MGININIPSYMQHLTNNSKIVEVSGGIVGDCLSHLVRQFPGVKEMLFSENGKLLDSVAIYVNGKLAYQEELRKPVKDGDKLDILHIVGGG